jgi:hypothetical protein
VRDDARVQEVYFGAGSTFDRAPPTGVAVRTPRVTGAEGGTASAAHPSPPDRARHA